MKNKRYYLFAALFLLSVGKWLKDKQDNLAPKKVAQTKTEVVKAQDNQEVEEVVEKSEPEVKDVPYSERPTQSIKFDPEMLPDEVCPQMPIFYKKDIVEEEELATNLHFVIEGEIFRIRMFIEDASYGSYRKLVYYKEDSQGFPVNIRIPIEHSTNPTDQIIESYIKGGKIVYESADRRINLKDGRSMTYSVLDGELTKFNSDRDNCYFEPKK